MLTQDKHISVSIVDNEKCIVRALANLGLFMDVLKGLIELGVVYFIKQMRRKDATGLLNTEVSVFLTNKIKLAYFTI